MKIAEQHSLKLRAHKIRDKMNVYNLRVGKRYIDNKGEIKEVLSVEIYWEEESDKIKITAILISSEKLSFYVVIESTEEIKTWEEVVPEPIVKGDEIKTIHVKVKPLLTKNDTISELTKSVSEAYKLLSKVIFQIKHGDVKSKINTIEEIREMIGE